MLHLVYKPKNVELQMIANAKLWLNCTLYIQTKAHAYATKAMGGS